VTDEKLTEYYPVKKSILFTNHFIAEAFKDFAFGLHMLRGEPKQGSRIMAEEMAIPDGQDKTP